MTVLNVSHDEFDLCHFKLMHSFLAIFEFDRTELAYFLGRRIFAGGMYLKFDLDLLVPKSRA